MKKIISTFILLIILIILILVLICAISFCRTFEVNDCRGKCLKKKAQTIDKGTYRTVTNNCGHFVARVLASCGIGKSSFWDNYPWVVINTLVGR